MFSFILISMILCVITKAAPPLLSADRDPVMNSPHILEFFQDDTDVQDHLESSEDYEEPLEFVQAFEDQDEIQDSAKILDVPVLTSLSQDEELIEEVSKSDSVLEAVEILEEARISNPLPEAEEMKDEDLPQVENYRVSPLDPQGDHYQGLQDEVKLSEEAYEAKVGLYSNDNGYGQRSIECHDEERVQFVDKCVPYQEETCYTQVQETCEMETFSNCTGVIANMAERKCFTVKELVCGLQEDVSFYTLQEEYMVQVCSTLKERICDTTFQIDLTTRDDFQCTNLEYGECEEAESVLNDVTCKKTIEFQCRKEKRPFEEGYGKKTVCEKVPKETCYDTPRTVRQELCLPRIQRYCQKFTNPFPQTREQQNCHFEPKKVCELETRSRPRKARRYSYTQECHPVSRQLCDTIRCKELVPDCVQMERPRCEHVPIKSCSKEDKQYCYKEEVVTKERVCDRKFKLESL